MRNHRLGALVGTGPTYPRSHLVPLDRQSGARAEACGRGKNIALSCAWVDPNRQVNNSAVLRISSKNHSGKGRKSDKLPKDLETFVQAEFLIASHHRDLFRQSLGDDLTVEGIRVQERQIEKRECMVRSVR